MLPLLYIGRARVHTYRPLYNCNQGYILQIDRSFGVESERLVTRLTSWYWTNSRRDYYSEAKRLIGCMFVGDFLAPVCLDMAREQFELLDVPTFSVWLTNVSIALSNGGGDICNIDGVYM